MESEQLHTGAVFLTQVETRILLRLALVFGFGCDCDETETLGAWDTVMSSAAERRQAVWRTFAGHGEPLPDGREMRGSSLQDFAGDYYEFLKIAATSGTGVVHKPRNPIPRHTLTQRKGGKKLDENVREANGRLEFDEDWPEGTPRSGSPHYSLKLDGQMNVSLQLIACWSSGGRSYAFRDMRLTLDLYPVRKAIRIDDHSHHDSEPTTTVNGATAKFTHPGLFPAYDLAIRLSSVLGLHGGAIFPGSGPKIFRLTEVKEGTRFEGVLHVCSGTLACVDGPDDDSARSALLTAVEQFLILHGRESESRDAFVPVSRKGWTVQS
jgi:hypothetical protein